MSNIKRGWVVFTIVFMAFLVCCINVSAAPLHFYRFWNTEAGEGGHFYTSDKTEKAIANQDPFYIYEGIQGYLYTTNEDGRIPLYRLYNSANKLYIYTANDAERTALIAAGWEFQKTEGFCYPSPPASGAAVVPLHHFEHTVELDNFYTTSDAEKDGVLSRPYPPWNQYVYRGVECYLGAFTGTDKKQIILSLYTSNNSHAGNWSSIVYQTTISGSCEGTVAACGDLANQNQADCEAIAECYWKEEYKVYKHPEYDIYYDEIFGYSYAGTKGGGAADPEYPHVCELDMSNKVLELYQEINSHAQKDGGSLPYTVDICYGDLECQVTPDSASTNCPAGYKTVVRLFQEENSHLSNSTTRAYPYKICCKTSYFPTSTTVYWADMAGNLITEADVGDTVLLIYENHASQGFSFNIKEDDALVDDDIETISNTFNYGPHLAAKWAITEEMYGKGGNEAPEEHFYFRVDTFVSGDLKVLKPTSPPTDTDSPPNAIITYPAYALLQDQRRFKVNNNINFQENSWDVDDSLKLTWEFGDGSSISCNWPEEDCDKQHQYATSGTKSVYLRAEEVGRSKKSSNYTEVYIYDIGTNVFAIINLTKNVFAYTDFPISFNGSQSYAAKCQTGSCPVAACYPVADLFCYDRLKSDIAASGFGKYNLWFNWIFSNGEKKYGNWADNYVDSVDFTKYLYNPQKYKVNLSVGYEEFT